MISNNLKYECRTLQKVIWRDHTHHRLTFSRQWRAWTCDLWSYKPAALKLFQSTRSELEERIDTIDTAIRYENKTQSIPENSTPPALEPFCERITHCCFAKERKISLKEMEAHLLARNGCALLQSCKRSVIACILYQYGIRKRTINKNSFRFFQNVQTGFHIPWRKGRHTSSTFYTSELCRKDSVFFQICFLNVSNV